MTWAHPLIKSLNLPGVLADQNVPVYITELKESDADEKFGEEERERLRKHIVDSYIGVKFIVSGSAAAALKLKSNESGAGRFTDFLLPPLTFQEYLKLKDILNNSNEKKITIL